MYLILAEGYKNANVEFLTIKPTNEIRVSTEDFGSGIGVKNISDLALKEIHGICKTKNPTKQQVNEYNITKGEIYKKFTNLSKNNQIQKIIKILTLKMMSWLLSLNDVEEKKQEV